MKWLDLSAYGLVLKIADRTPNPPVMFIMDGGDRIAAALVDSGFNRTSSGLWVRIFSPPEAAAILSGLRSALKQATVCDVDPQDVLQGSGRHVPAPAATPAATDVLASHPESRRLTPPVIADAPKPAHPENEAGAPADTTKRATTAPAADHGRTVETGRGLEDVASAADPLAALAAMAASWSRRPFLADRTVTPPPVLPEKGEAAQAPREQIRIAAPRTTPERTVFCTWIVSTSAVDARILTGAADLPETTYIVARIGARDDVPVAEGNVGKWLRLRGTDEIDVRVDAVVRGTENSGFGGAGDFLVVGRSAERAGPRLDAGAVEAGAAA